LALRPGVAQTRPKLTHSIRQNNASDGCRLIPETFLRLSYLILSQRAFRLQGISGDFEKFRVVRNCLKATI
jgi:hypothetical protein